ncbi:MAG: ribokinase [SAR202 cluster bacterium]|nr:ribokinase [SAR202 cluster bacterium]
MALIGVADRLPKPGETLRGERFYTASGGKGATQAVAAARLGAHVRMVGRVGDDLFGPLLLNALTVEGIDVTGVAVDQDHPSGVGMILLDKNRENHITAIYGANLQCDDDQVRSVQSALEGADVLLLQMEIPFDVSLSAARVAAAGGARVILDPAPATEIALNKYADLDIITPNQMEAEFHTGIRVSDVSSAKAAAKVLLERGVAAAVVKMAGQGVYYATESTGGYIEPFEVSVVDTVSAGDAFSGALGVALAEGKSFEDAVRYGAAAGALAVTRRGVQGSMPLRCEVESLLSQG